MRTTLLFSAVLVASLLSAQDDWIRLFYADPYMSNGYFMVNDQKRQQMGAAKVAVDLIYIPAAGPNAGIPQVAQHVEIVPPIWYTHLDLVRLPDLQPGDQVGYHVQALASNGDVVEDHMRTDGSTPYEEYCRTTCNSAAYAWSLVASENPQHTNTIISIRNGTTGGNPFYFYVSAPQWVAFQQQFTPSDWNLSGGNWWDAQIEQPTLIYPIDNIPSAGTDYQGFTLPANSSGYAIYKSKGPWHTFSAQTDQILGVDHCYETYPDGLRTLYNSDDLVQFALSQNGLNSLTCDAIVSNGGGGEGWGDSGTGICTSFAWSDGLEDVDGDGNIDPVGLVSTIIGCPDDGSVPDSYLLKTLSDVSTIVINHWYPNSVTHALVIDIPDTDDPRLVPVPRTVLQPGLYEYMVIFNDGTIWRKYQSYTTSKVISANFASFTDITAYPVPVRDDVFSLDINTVAPMTIRLNIVNNQGVQYYMQDLVLDVAGRNKHVVKMSPPWPSGIYHCVFTYSDNSSESVSITVD